MLGRGNTLRYVCALLFACFLFSELAQVEAGPINHGGDYQLREAVKRAIELAYPGTDMDLVKMSERADLDQRVSQFAQKARRLVSFYSLDDVDSASLDGSVWAVVSGDSPRESDELYSFEKSDGVEQSSQKFNGLLSHLALSIADRNATSIAQLFLDCCLQEASGQTVIDESDVRLLVQVYYLWIYGDVWRALEAYTEWWQGYEKTSVDLMPTAVIEGSVLRVRLERVELKFGMHPQLQQWDVAVSHDGSVRVLAVGPIYPKQSLWVSYSFRSDFLLFPVNW